MLEGAQQAVMLGDLRAIKELKANRSIAGAAGSDLRAVALAALANTVA